MRFRNVKKSLPSRLRLRLTTGLLELLFSFLTLFPSVHLVAEHSHPVCSLTCETPQTADSGLTDASSGKASSDSCWGCLFASHLDHTDVLTYSSPVGPVPATPYAVFFPAAPVLSRLYAANRAQAPPACE